MTAKEYYQKGIDLYQAGKYGEAIACFDEAVECSRGAANNCFYKGYDL
ncbi:MAG: tetratricopeptide repeat protein, partial [Dysgonamonadaceae bacterium]|nr:tetratricopeptide repeat protein [Dysgonamonadaceae bacterium]